MTATATEVPAPPRQQTECPHCGNPVAGLLAQCWKPDCLSADIADDAAYERSTDQ